MTTREAAALYARTGHVAPPDIAAPSANKYNARRKEVDGKVFDSSGEARAYRLLRSWEQCGAITGLELQPEYVLQEKFRDGSGQMHREIKYRGDFRFIGPEGEVHVIDFKGLRTSVYRLKRKMFQQKYQNIVFEEWDNRTLVEAVRG